MIHEHIILSGSLNISGSFVIPSGTSGTEPVLPQPGNLFFNTAEKRLYIWEGEWVAAGSQTTPPLSADIEYLVVAGGGGNAISPGNNGAGNGGGGAGGLLSSSLSSIESGSSITVIVGAGGIGQAQGGSSTIASLSGTLFSTVSTTGGGAGGQGRYSTTTDTDTDGFDGGSGGGGGNAPSGDVTGGAATIGQGNIGGTGRNDSYQGGGGGGAGAQGGDATTTIGGAGGNGLQSSITGTSTYYAGGGGGGTFDGTPGTGGLGGGSAGETYSGGQPSNGTANTGGGGGGIANRSLSNVSGGSGVVILAYNSGSINAIGGQEGDAGNGRKYHKFGTSGTFYIGNALDYKVITDGLYVHYDLANINSYAGSGTTITDLQGNIDLTIVSTPSFTELNGGGLDLDGSTNYAYASSLNFTPYCIDYWWTNDDTIGTAVMQGNYQQALGMGNYPGGITLGAFTGGMTDETIAFWGSADISNGATYIRDVVNIGTHNIVINWNGTSYDIWVDGVKKTTYAIDTHGHCTLHSRDSIFLGKDDAGGGYEFDGKIHNFRIYTSSLSDNQVLQNYNALRKRFGL